MLNDKKFWVLVALIVILPIFTIILSIVFQSCGNNGSAYDAYEKKMITAAKKYLRVNDISPKAEGEIVKISLNTLVENKYIKLSDSTCNGSVSVRKNGSLIEKTNGGFLNYLANLNCKKYNTNTLNRVLKENIVTEGSGLYSVNGEYIYKGNKPKNYITFYDKKYRIMGITEDGLVKLIKIDTEPVARIWDNKYNIDVKQSYGKNIYKDSELLRYLNEDYMNKKKITEDVRMHIVSNDVCIGKRSKNDFSISKAVDCQEILENQVLTVMNVSDYALASLDVDCNSIVSRSCNNYNYLKGFSTFTWTTNPVLENTYEVFFNSGGVISYQNANQYTNYNIVLYIDGDEKVKGGIGTEEDPYIIK